MSIPVFDSSSGNLPPGIYCASWDEVQLRFGYNARRRELLDGLEAALIALKAAGCRRVYLNGSFVTAKEFPGDFDGCWELENVDIDILESAAPALLDFKNRRAAQKAAYGGELFPARWRAEPSGRVYLDFFQRDKNGGAKGIIAIELSKEFL